MTRAAAYPVSARSPITSRSSLQHISTPSFTPAWCSARSLRGPTVARHFFMYSAWPGLGKFEILRQLPNQAPRSYPRGEFFAIAYQDNVVWRYHANMDALR